MRIGAKSLEIDDKTTAMDVTPEITNGRTMLPIRHVAEAVGAKVTWNGKTKSATIKSQADDIITCKIEKNTISVNGAGQSLDVAPYVKSGRTYLPIRAVSEALGFDVQWEQKTKTVTLTAPYQTSRIIALADETLEVGYLGAQTSLYDGSGMWVLQFNSPAEAKVGIALLKAESITVEPDTYCRFPVGYQLTSGNQVKIHIVGAFPIATLTALLPTIRVFFKIAGL